MGAVLDIVGTWSIDISVDGTGSISPNAGVTLLGEPARTDRPSIRVTGDGNDRFLSVSGDLTVRGLEIVGVTGVSQLFDADPLPAGEHDAGAFCTP
ncbi:MAG TPA: hypothetical protein VGF99_02430 [Myxococcota bacterium]